MLMKTKSNLSKNSLKNDFIHHFKSIVILRMNEWIFIGKIIIDQKTFNLKYLDMKKKNNNFFKGFYEKIIININF
jgi:hypothetical protein